MSSNAKSNGMGGLLGRGDSPPPINPYTETINVRSGPALLMVVNQYREEDPFRKKHETDDVPTLVEYSLNDFDNKAKA